MVFVYLRLFLYGLFFVEGEMGGAMMATFTINISWSWSLVHNGDLRSQFSSFVVSHFLFLCLLIFSRPCDCCLGIVGRKSKSL